MPSNRQASYSQFLRDCWRGMPARTLPLISPIQVHAGTRLCVLFQNAQQVRKVTKPSSITPHRLAIIFPDHSPLCWSQCNHSGTLVHIWWHFPLLRCFWPEVFNLLTSVTHITCTPDPKLALLSVGIEQWRIQF